MSDIRKVAVLGTGVLGSQIAFQTAYSGFDVVAYDISEEALEQARARLAALVETYTNEVSGAAGGKAAGALKRIALLSDLGAAVADADLVIEAVPEVLSIKQALYEKLAGLAPDRTIFATNSVNGGRIPGHRGGVKAGHWRWGAADMARAPIGTLAISAVGIDQGMISPVSGSALSGVAWFCSAAAVARRRPADCLRR